ncbi:ABC transporter substrate-binding protein [Terrarubrum flagellatum]|uniref:ABC transporter substrate-binding protein n=1 Tax=Terrirubrum flagellatum TaxID=2895980 RepID=UPI003144EE73
MKHRSIILSAVAIGLAGLIASPASAQEDTLRIRLNADIRSTDPGINRDANTDAVVLHMVEGLVAYCEDTSVGPLLAKSVDVSPDGKVYTFNLRDDVKFHNGAPLTADDVLFSWKRYVDPANNWRCLPEVDGRGLAKVVNVEAKDAKTVVFTLEKPSALFLTVLARPDCGETAIYHRDSLTSDGKWKDPIGTGPFKMGEWKRGQYIDLLRNDSYAALPGKRDGHTGGKAPLVAKVRFPIIPDSSAAKAALLSGGLDVIYDVQNSDIPDYKQRKDVTLREQATMDINGLLFQTRDPLLKDVRIRRALTLALDIPQLVETVTEGASKPSLSIIPTPSSYYGKTQAELPKRDIAAAKKLLAEAGYNGQPIKMLATKRYPSIFDMAVLAQAMAQEAGVKIDVEVLDWATLLDRYNKGDYQAMSFSYSSRLDPSLSFEMISGDKDAQPRKVWDNAESRKLMTRSMEISDRAQRQALFDDLEAKFRADAPMIVLYSAVETSAARANVQNYSGWALGQPRAWGVSLKSGS